MKPKLISVSDVLFSKVRQNVLRLFFVTPDRDFYTNEVIRLTDSGTGAVQRELNYLTKAGLLSIKRVGNQCRYQANSHSPFFFEIRSIVVKSFGLVDLIRAALSPLHNKIELAFIYGSVAKQTDTQRSDIDLLIMGSDLVYGDIFGYLESVEQSLGRKISPSFYTVEDWLRKVKQQNHFVTSIIKESKLFVIGTEDEFKKFR
jgi:predicted nucleotidyltransferase